MKSGLKSWLVLEHEALRKTLKCTNGDFLKAAVILGLSLSTVYRKASKFGLWPRKKKGSK